LHDFLFASIENIEGLCNTRRKKNSLKKIFVKTMVFSLLPIDSLGEIPNYGADFIRRYKMRNFAYHSNHLLLSTPA